jgi:hypothetical protein
MVYESKIVNGVECLGDEFSGGGVRADEVEGRGEEGSDVRGGRRCRSIFEVRFVGLVGLPHVGDRRVGSSLFPFLVSTAHIGRMRVPFVLVTICRAVTKIPRGVIPRFRVPDLVHSRAVGSGGLKVFDEGGGVLGLRLPVGRRRLVRRA